MGAHLAYPSVVQNQDLVGVHQGGDPVGDQNGGALHIFPDGLADLLVSFHVHGGEGVVKHLDGGVLHQHPGDGHPLLLPAGNGHAPLANGGVVPLGKVHNGVVDHRQPCKVPHGFQVGAGGAVGDALFKALGEEEGLLQHDADVFPQVGQVHVPDVHPADGDGAVFMGQLVEPVQQVHQSGFPRAGGPQNAKGGARLDHKAHVVEHAPFALAVAKVHVVEHNVPVHGRLLGIRAVFLLFGVQDVEQPGGADGGLAQFRQQPPQVPGGPHQHGVVGGKGQKLPFCQGAPLHKEHPGHNDDQHLEPGEKVPQAPVEAHHFAQAHPQVGEFFIFFVKAVDLIALPAKGPHHPHAGEVFLHQGGEAALAFVGGLELLPGDDVKDQGGGHDHRHKAAHDQGELHVHGEHQRQGHQDQQHGAHHLHQLVADKVAHQVHVLGAALDDVAGLVGVVPGVGQALDVVEQGVPHPGHRALAGPGQVHPGGIVGKPGNGRKGQGHQSAERDVLPQGFAAAHGVDPIYQEPGQVKGVVVDHRIHGDPDHLGGHVVCHHRQDHHQKRQDEFSPEPFGKGEKSQDV